MLFQVRHLVEVSELAEGEEVNVDLNNLRPPRGRAPRPQAAWVAARAPARARRQAKVTRVRRHAPVTTAFRPGSKAARCRCSGVCRSAASRTRSGRSTTIMNVGQLEALIEDRDHARSSAQHRLADIGKPVKVLGDGDVTRKITRAARTRSATARAPRSKQPAAASSCWRAEPWRIRSRICSRFRS